MWIGFEYSPLGIEKYYCIHTDKGPIRVCSVFEKNGQGWFFRKSIGNQIGEVCDSEESANKTASDYMDEFKRYYDEGR